MKLLCHSTSLRSLSSMSVISSSSLSIRTATSYRLNPFKSFLNPYTIVGEKYSDIIISQVLGRTSASRSLLSRVQVSTEKDPGFSPCFCPCLQVKWKFSTKMDSSIFSNMKEFNLLWPTYTRLYKGSTLEQGIDIQKLRD